MDKASIEQLCRDGAFGHPTGDFILRETHISWVILCGDYAYKLKKPVNFGFLDFSTLALRQHYCQEELRLNRRFSPELYLSVVPVTLEDEGPVMNGPGEPVDYAVKMRRFDESQLLDNIAARGELDHSLLRAISRELARLHAELPCCFPDPSGAEAGTPIALKAAVEQNFEQLRRYPLQSREQSRLETIEQWAAARYSALLPIMRQRVRDGWIIDGHGDDHLGNMAVIDGAVRLFDCIEFNAELRVMDTIGEIALLDMDLNARGHPAESHRLLTDYLEYRGDYAGLALLDFYRSYYAMVRAKVNLLREPTDHPQLTKTDAWREFCRYLDLARRYCDKGPRFLAITYGVSGSGKSTVAGKLVEASGAVRIRSDVERKRLVGMAPEQRSHSEDLAKLYSADMSSRTFQHLQELASVVLDAGFPVIVDGTFLHRHVRDDFHKLASQLRLPFVILDCIADPGEIRRRLLARESSLHDASEAGLNVMEQQSRQIEPLTDVELTLRLAVDSAQDADQLWESLRQQL